MLRAGPAGGPDLSAERLARAKDADGGIARGDSGLRRKFADRHSVHLDPPDGLLVFGLERGCQALHAPADLVVEIGRRLDRTLHFPGERFERAVAGSAAAVMVDDRVAQHPVEPGDGRRFISNVSPLLQAPDERILKDILGQGRVAQAAFEEPEEFAVVINEAGGQIRGRHEHPL